MKKVLIGIPIVAVFVFVGVFAMDNFSSPVDAAKKEKCTTIQSGELVGSDGSVLDVGFNEWGYNYQGHLFNGMWCDYHPNYRPGGGGYDWCQENMSNVELAMKWNDAWLSNQDCIGDNKLDRHFGFTTYTGSGAWLTNHISGEYEMDGEMCKWNYFTKIVAPPSDSTKLGGVWYAADGTEIGPVIWGSFATIQTVENDTCAGINGLQYKSPLTPGFGFYAP